MNSLAQKIEALLFALGRPMSRKELMEKLAVGREDLELALHILTEGGRGVVCVDDGREVEMRVGIEAADLVTKIRKEEQSRDIGRAGLETLSAILYRGPLTRSEIDFIRGVNSSQILRTLLMRGLVRRVTNPKDERSFLYEPTTELMSELGITRNEQLPDFSVLKKKLSELEAAYRGSGQDDDSLQ